ncbi:MAG: RNA polymerase sigma factor, partial [Anaerovoracaceae bacterium]
MELEDYVKRYRDGDAEAFTSIYELTKDKFYRTACSHSGGANDAAEEALSEAYIQIAKSLGSLEDPSKFMAWGNRIVVSKVYDYYRKNSHEVLAADSDDEYT